MGRGNCSRDSRSSAAATLGAVVCLGYALQLNDGKGDPQAFAWLAAAVGFATVGTLAPAWRRFERLGDAPILFLAGVGLAFGLGQFLLKAPSYYLRPTAWGLTPFYVCLALGGVLGGGVLSRGPWAGRFHVPLLLATYFALGVWLIHVSPRPHIDVFIFQRDGIASLLTGENPYVHRYPDIYGDAALYGPGMSVDGWLRFGFPYPPLSLFLAIPGQIVAGDYRYSQLVAMTLAGGVMAYTRGGRLGRAAMVLFLFTPRNLFVLGNGWTEPLLIGLLSLTVFAACRAPRLTPYLFGLLASAKQYVVLVLPAYLLLIPRPWRWRDVLRALGRGAASGLLVTLPLALWDYPAFYKSVVALQFLQPFRPQALSFLAWSVNATGRPGPELHSVIPFGLAMLMTPLALWRAPRTPAGFATMVGFVMLVYFAVTKQSFCNHYFFPLGAMCLAVAASDPEAVGRSAADAVGRASRTP
jgi:hypothetical protein